MPLDVHPPRSRAWPVVVPEVLTSAAALYGGVGLAWDDAIGMPDDWLRHGPFSSWLVPGLLLLAVVAAPMVLAAALELRRSPWAPITSIGAAAALIGWIGAQMLLLQRYDVLQPVVVGVGLLVLLLAVWCHGDRPLRPAADAAPRHPDQAHHLAPLRWGSSGG